MALRAKNPPHQFYSGLVKHHTSFIHKQPNKMVLFCFILMSPIYHLCASNLVEIVKISWAQFLLKTPRNGQMSNVAISNQHGRLPVSFIVKSFFCRYTQDEHANQISRETGFGDRIF